MNTAFFASIPFTVKPGWFPNLETEPTVSAASIPTCWAPGKHMEAQLSFELSGSACRQLDLWVAADGQFLSLSNLAAAMGVKSNAMPTNRRRTSFHGKPSAVVGSEMVW